MTTDLIYASGQRLFHDWYNEHAVPHTSWIASRHPDRPRPSIRQRIARFLIALGGRVASVPPGQQPVLP